MFERRCIFQGPSCLVSIVFYSKFPLGWPGKKTQETNSPCFTLAEHAFMLGTLTRPGPPNGGLQSFPLFQANLGYLSW